MQHRDAEVSDVVIVLKSECAAEKLPQTTDALKKLGMEIESIDEGNGVVCGTVDAGKVEEIRKWPCINYVRVESTYIADYPANDPRNQDPAEEPNEDSDD